MKRLVVIFSLFVAVHLSNSCGLLHRRANNNLFTHYVVFYHKDHIPWTEIRCISMSPAIFIESASDTLIERDIKKVTSLFNYFDSLSQLPESVLLDDKYSFTHPEFRHVDTDLALVFVGKDRRDTLALESQHFGGISFHQRYFKDSVGHFKVFNIIKERDSTWARKFDELYVNGQYLL